MEASIPAKLEFLDHGTHIEIARKWFRARFVLLTAVAAIWNGLVFFLYGQLGPEAGTAQYYGPIVHILIGIGLAYYVLAGWLNRTDLGPLAPSLIRRVLVLHNALSKGWHARRARGLTWAPWLPHS